MSRVLFFTKNRWQLPSYRFCVFLIALFTISGCKASNETHYPVKDSGLVVDASLSIGSNNFYWLDNHRIIVQTRGKIASEPTIKNQLEEVSLVIWDTNTNREVTLIPPQKANVGSLCVTNKLFKSFTLVFSDRPLPVIGYIGEFDENMQIKNLRPNIKTGELDKISCQLKSDVLLPEWVKKIPPTDIVLLRPEHGFIVIYRDDILQWPTSVKLYRPKASQTEGIDFSKQLTKPTDAFVFGLIPMFYSFKGAYYLGAISGPETPVWWLNIDGTLQQDKEIHQQKSMKISNTASAGWLYPTRKLSPVTAVSSFRAGDIGDDGLYTFNHIKIPIRLVKGRIDNKIDISPDGCSVAFLNDDRPKVSPDKPMLFRKLQVINLCMEKNNGNP